MLRETTSRGQCELVCPSRTCELVCPSRTNERGGEGYCVKGGGEEGERERERAGRVRLPTALDCVLSFYKCVCTREKSSTKFCTDFTNDVFFVISKVFGKMFTAC